MKRRNKETQVQYGPFPIAVILVVLVLSFSCIAAINVSKENSENLNNYVLELLSLYCEGIGNDIINEIDDLEINGSSLMGLAPDLSDQAIESALRGIIANARSTLSNIVFVGLEGGRIKVLTPYYPVSEDELYPLFSQITGYDQSPIIQTTRSKFLDPYEEPMGKSTILPYLVMDSDSSLAIIFYINITNLLVVQTSIQENSILSSQIAFDINLYSPDGLLLETSANRALKYAGTLMKDDIYSHFQLHSEALQLYSYVTDEAIWMMKKDSSTGLSVAIKAPVDIVKETSQSTQLSILVIAVLCFISIFLIIFIGVKTLRDYQVWTRLQEESRFETLQNKMNPHLLFNTLDSIAYAAEEDDKESVLLCIKSLAYILQSNLRETSIECPVIQQVKYLFSYIHLQEIRYEDKFSFDLDEELGDYSLEDLYILRYSVQPIVENCFKHSVYQGADHVKIRVKYELEGETLRVTVKNTGSAMSEEDLRALKERLQKSDSRDASHLGLMSIDRRIKLRYGNWYGIDLPYDPVYFIVIVRLPLLEA